MYKGPFKGYPKFYNGLLHHFRGNGIRPRLYVELKLKKAEKNCKFVPKSCIATLTPNKFNMFQYPIMKNG